MKEYKACESADYISHVRSFVSDYLRRVADGHVRGLMMENKDNKLRSSENVVFVTVPHVVLIPYYYCSRFDKRDGRRTEDHIHGKHNIYDGDV